jgi:hypothetical protein
MPGKSDRSQGASNPDAGCRWHPSSRNPFRSSTLPLRKVKPEPRRWEFLGRLQTSRLSHQPLLLASLFPAEDHSKKESSASRSGQGYSADQTVVRCDPSVDCGLQEEMAPNCQS